MTLLGDVEGPPDSPLTARAAFAGYLLLDALIGNTDRHHQNWGLLRGRGPALRLAPTFDHASSLGFLLNDAQRVRYLSQSGGQSVDAYAARARSPWSGKISPIDAAIAAASMLTPEEQAKWRARSQHGYEAAVDSVRRVPNSRMSSSSREFALSLIRHNFEELSMRMAGLSS